MKRGKIAAFYHCHPGEVLVVIGEDNDSCLILFAEVQDFTADLMGVVLGQVLQVHVVLPVWLGTIVSHCVWSGFLYSGLQQLATVAVRISAPAGVYSQLISLLIQNAAHCEGVCVCKADTAQARAFCHSFFGSAGVAVLLFHRDIQQVAPALFYQGGRHKLTILGKGASFQIAVCPDPFLTVPQLQANGSVGEVGIHSFKKGNLGFQLLRESGLKFLGAFHCGRCFVDGGASQVDRYFPHW